jgi:hypothetical protein
MSAAGFWLLILTKPLGDWMSVRLLLPVKKKIFRMALKNHGLAKARMIGASVTG